MWFRDKKTNATEDEVAMQQVMTMLDEWKAPEVSPWFDARMMARFREEQQQAPVGWLARLRDRWVLDSGSVLKPAMIVALGVVMIAGGGGYWQALHTHLAQPVVSATVQDLQVLDNNAQTIQVMGQLLDDSDDSQPQS